MDFKFWHDLNPFVQARIKLTTWYLLIYLSLIAFFTYLTLDARNSSYLRVYRVIEGAAPGSSQVQEYSDRYNELNDEFKKRLYLFDLVLILGGSVVAWWLSGKTLEPIGMVLEAEQAFVGDVSHSLRTPLTTLALLLSAYEKTGPHTRKKTIELVTSVQEEVFHLKRLVEGLLSMARARHNVMKMGFVVVDLPDLLTHCQGLMNRVAVQKKQAVLVKVHSPVKVKGDYDQLKQVLLVLLDNAIKYGPLGATITLTLNSTGNKVRIGVSDTGPGMSIGESKKLFRRFSRGKNTAHTAKGTGLGLAIAKVIVEAHGGVIRISSKPGKGTVVSIYLPRFS